jgi:hypothetical protein
MRRLAQSQRNSWQSQSLFGVTAWAALHESAQSDSSRVGVGHDLCHKWALRAG